MNTMGHRLYIILWTIFLLYKMTIYGCRIKDLTSHYEIIVDKDAKINALNPVLNVRCTNDMNEMVGVKAKCLFHKWKVPHVCNKYCAPINAKDNLKVDYSYQILRNGVTAKFQCTGQGLFLHGHETSTCMSTGAWSNPAPRCLDKLNLYFSKGQNATLTCKSPSCTVIMWQFEEEFVLTHKNSFPNLKNNGRAGTLDIINMDETLTGRYVCSCIDMDSESTSHMTYNVNLTKKHRKFPRKPKHPKHRHSNEFPLKKSL